MNEILLDLLRDFMYLRSLFILLSIEIYTLIRGAIYIAKKSTVPCKSAIVSARPKFTVSVSYSKYESDVK